MINRHQQNWFRECKAVYDRMNKIKWTFGILVVGCITTAVSNGRNHNILYTFVSMCVIKGKVIFFCFGCHSNELHWVAYAQQSTHKIESFQIRNNESYSHFHGANSFFSVYRMTSFLFRLAIILGIILYMALFHRRNSDVIVWQAMSRNRIILAEMYLTFVQYLSYFIFTHMLKRRHLPFLFDINYLERKVTICKRIVKIEMVRRVYVCFTGEHILYFIVFVIVCTWYVLVSYKNNFYEM